MIALQICVLTVSTMIFGWSLMSLLGGASGDAYY
jgi:hypothetical protein